MSDDTVEVKVTLPKPPEGIEYEVVPYKNEYDLRGLLSISVEIKLRRVAPPERMVTLTLPEKAVRFLTELHDRTAFTGPLIDGIQEAARKALAEAQEACGVLLYKNDDDTYSECSAGNHKGGCYQCNVVPKGHKEPHRP